MNHTGHTTSKNNVKLISQLLPDARLNLKGDCYKFKFNLQGNSNSHWRFVT